MPQAVIGAALAPVAGAAVGGLVGGGGAKNAQSATPKDLQGMRGSNIGLLNYLLGFNQQAPWNTQQPQQLPASQGGPIQRQGQHTAGGGGPTPWPGVNQSAGPMWGAQTPWSGVNAGAPQGGVNPSINIGSMAPQLMQQAQGGTAPVGGTNPILKAMGGAVPFNGPQANSQTGAVPFSGPMANAQAPQNDMLGRIESYFGQLGTPTTDLQRQSLGGISQYLNSNPYGQSNNALTGVIGGGAYDGANNAFRGVQGTDYFGGAQQAFQNTGNQNLFGGAEQAFQGLQGANPFQPAQSALEGMFAQNPGQGMLDALRPSFERNLAAANQQGGRFGSANAILRSRAVDDYNLLGAQALQRGVDQQINAAGQYGAFGNSLLNARNAAGQGLLGVGQGRLQQGLGVGQGMLGVGQGQLSQGLGAAQGLSGLAQALQGDRLNAAGQLASNQNSMFNNMTSGYQTGQSQANQEAQRQQQALQILLSQLGVSQQASLGGPTVVQPTGAQQGAQFGGQIGELLAILQRAQTGG